jgi:hypothetical protein
MAAFDFIEVNCGVALIPLDGSYPIDNVNCAKFRLHPLLTDFRPAIEKISRGSLTSWKHPCRTFLVRVHDSKF